jgi:chemotaxis protein methyltransferase CheR
MMEPAAILDMELKLLLDAIYLRFHYDFREYSMASLRRRVSQAMTQLHCSSVSRLQDKLLHEADAFPALLQYMTVQVSEMFRDASYWRSLREMVVPVLRTYPSLKIWIAGCSTGEEVYSFCILLREEGLLEQTLIYATDINAESLRRAQAGVFDLSLLPGFSRAYREAGGTGSLSDYYTAAYESAVFDKTLARNVVFSDHSLATDTVFSEVHLVSCRNVLIYFNAALQQRAISLFQESLVRKGFLGLGSKESLRSVAAGAAFEEVVREDRIFQKL